MNGRLRLFLCGVCVAIGVFHAPWSTHVLVEDMAGTTVPADRALSPDARVVAKDRTKPEDIIDSQHGTQHDARTTTPRR